MMHDYGLLGIIALQSIYNDYDLNRLEDFNGTFRTVMSDETCCHVDVLTKLRGLGGFWQTRGGAAWPQQIVIFRKCQIPYILILCIPDPLQPCA